MEYYYTTKDKINLEKNSLIIENFEYNHLVKVLRKKNGDKITITDGEYNIYHCEIASINGRQINCDILEKESNLNESKIGVSLYLSILRNPARFEFAVEKAVELGVKSIHPVITDHTVSKSALSNSKLERLNKIMIGAMGQSQRCFLPKLYQSISFLEMIESENGKMNKVVMYECSDDTTKFSYNKNSSETVLLIGPEGGFSINELTLLVESNWQIKSLGRRKLRAETAAIVSLYELLRECSDKL